MKDELINLRDQGYTYALVKTKPNGTEVWIDLDTPDPMNMSGVIENARTFWGMEDLETEQGWYFNFRDIEEIIEYKEE